MSVDPALPALALNLVPGVGPRLQQLLLERFGTAAAALSATHEQWRQIPGVGPKIIQQLAERDFLDMARREWEDCQDRGIEFIGRDDAAYPKLLTEIPDPPLGLYRWGTLLAQDQLAVAIVGSRNCTMYGRRMAEKLAGGLARAGITIVSGLARGIDGYAHQAALHAGGRTIAVCASGLAEIYPPEHGNLAQEISTQGAVLSESPLHRRPSRGLFPQRNRIVSGLSLGVIVVEASATSGTLHTARHAMEQGRDVFAIPGPVDRRESEGCHALIRDGVKLIRGVDDVLEDLGPLIEPIHLPVQSSEFPSRMAEQGTDAEIRSGHSESTAVDSSVTSREVRTPRELNLTEQERSLLDCLSDTPISVDAVIEQVNLPASRILSTITVLEMKRLVQRLPGNQLTRIPR